MNGWLIIVIGLILVGVGGFLGFYGAQLNNRADNAAASETFNTKITTVLSAIASAKESAATTPATPSAPGTAGNIADTQIKLANIEQNFSRWASNFIAQRDLKRSELERTKLDERNRELEVSKAYRKIFQYVIDVLRRAVEAYNTQAGTAFQVELRDLPVNLYDVSDRPMEFGMVKFRAGTRWRVRIWSERPVHETRLPHLDIVIEDAAQAGADLVQIELIPPDYTIAVNGGGIVTAANINARESLASYEETLRTHLQKLLETQIAALPK